MSWNAEREKKLAVLWTQGLMFTSYIGAYADTAKTIINAKAQAAAAEAEAMARLTPEERAKVLEARAQARAMSEALRPRYAAPPPSRIESDDGGLGIAAAFLIGSMLF